jgi:hypothetical protein
MAREPMMETAKASPPLVVSVSRLEVSEPTDGKEVSCKVGTKEEEKEEDGSSLRLDGTREASATCFIRYSKQCKENCEKTAESHACIVL